MEVVRVAYDADADALYVYLRPHSEFGETVVFDDGRNVDVDVDGQVIGIEVLSPSAGFRLDDVIDRFGLEAVRDALEQVTRRTYVPVARRRQ